MRERINILCLVLAVTAIPAPSLALDGVSYEEIQGGLQKPTDLIFFWEGTPAIVSERCGTVQAVQAGSTTLLGSIGSTVDCSQTQAGLIGLAGHVVDDSAGYIYAYYTVKGATPKQHRVVRYDVSRAGDSITVDWNEQQLIVDELPAFQVGNGGGGLAIGPDDSLYIGVGYDGNTNAVQDVAQKHGKVLRLTLDGGIPLGNPVFDGADALSSLFCLGVQRPVRLGVDSETGKLWIADVGMGLQEVNMVGGGENLGWPTYEGDKQKQPSIPLTGGTHTGPVYSYSSVGGAPMAVVIGAPYRATSGELRFPSPFLGAIPVADFYQSWLRMLRPTGDQWEVHSFDSTGVMNVRAIATGPDGALYFVEAGKNAITRLAWTDTKPTVSIDSPKEDHRYEANETLTLEGSATDEEDGELVDEFMWEVVLLDSKDEIVDAKPMLGQKTTYTLPGEVDINGSLFITLTVADSVGTTATTSITLSPGATRVKYATVPEEGVSLTIAGEEITPPMEKMYSPGTIVSVSCPQEAVLGDAFDLYTFDNWTDGGEPTHDFVVPESDFDLVCTMKKHGPPPTPDPPTNVIVDAGTTDVGGPDAGKTSDSSSSGCRHTVNGANHSYSIWILLMGFILWRGRKRLDGIVR